MLKFGDSFMLKRYIICGHLSSKFRQNLRLGHSLSFHF